MKKDNDHRFEFLQRLLLAQGVTPGGGPNQRIKVIAQNMELVDDVFALAELRWGPDGSVDRMATEVKERAAREMAKAPVQPPVVDVGNIAPSPRGAPKPVVVAPGPTPPRRARVMSASESCPRCGHAAELHTGKGDTCERKDGPPCDCPGLNAL